MATYLSLQEINPCMRAAGLEVPIASMGPKRQIYDHELIYCHKGSFTVHYDNHHVLAQEGMILIIPPRVPHRLDYRHGREVYWVHLDFFYHNDQEDLARYIAMDKDTALSPQGYSPSYVRPDLLIKPNHRLPESYTVKDALATKEAYQTLIDLFINKPYDWSFQSKAILSQILSETFHHLKVTDSASKTSMIGQALADYLKKNAHRRVSGKELANRFHYHEDTLGRYFKKEIGVTIKDYQNQLRLEKIKHLLLETNLSLEEIAEEVQMTDRSHLTRFFKNASGITPGRYRQR